MSDAMSNSMSDAIGDSLDDDIFQERRRGGIPGLWWAALVCFVVAGLSGTLLRFGFLLGLPWGLDASNLRHAHSHLMYFAWATPAIAVHWLVRRYGGKRDGTGMAAGWAALLLGVVAYPFFLIAGYGPVALLGRNLPLASILSGFNTFAWYLLGAWHFAAHRGVQRTPALRLMDVAVAGLWLSTAGAWGRAALQFAGARAGAGAVTELLGGLAVQLFLGAFSHGWLLLATLGIALTSVAGEGAPARTGLTRGKAATMLLVAGLPGASFAGVIDPVALGAPVAVAVLLGLSTLAFVSGAAWHGWLLARHVVSGRRWEWMPFVIWLAVTLVMLAGSALPALAAWGIRMNLRILYLHVLALGVASSGLMTAAHDRWQGEGAPAPWAFGAAVLLLLAGVVSLSLQWGTPEPAWPRAFAAYTSVAPLVPVVYRMEQRAWAWVRRRAGHKALSGTGDHKA